LAVVVERQAMEASGARIEREVASWEGVTAGPHRFGGVEFRLGKRELGHLHGDRLADLPFKRAVRDMLVETGRAQPHHVVPESGWVSKPIETDEDADEVIELFRLSYERARVAEAVRAARSEPGAPA
jgi:Ni,Fe-hydrogenase I large subunit